MELNTRHTGIRGCTAGVIMQAVQDRRHVGFGLTWMHAAYPKGSVLECTVDIFRKSLDSFPDAFRVGRMDWVGKPVRFLDGCDTTEWLDAHLRSETISSTAAPRGKLFQKRHAARCRVLAEKYAALRGRTGSSCVQCATVLGASTTFELTAIACCSVQLC